MKIVSKCKHPDGGGGEKSKIFKHTHLSNLRQVILNEVEKRKAVLE